MTLTARIEGYASIFNVPDMNGDVVAPGAFAKALRQRGAEGVRMLYQHAVETPVGRWTKLKEDARGLYAEGELLLETETARDIAALIEGGALDGLSIGFQTQKAKKEREGRVILEADLWEISIVTFPMADGARIRRLAYPATDEAAFAAALKSAAGILGAAACSRLPLEGRPKPRLCEVSGGGAAPGLPSAARRKSRRPDPHPELLRDFDLPSRGRLAADYAATAPSPTSTNPGVE